MWQQIHNREESHTYSTFSYRSNCLHHFDLRKQTEQLYVNKQLPSVFQIQLHLKVIQFTPYKKAHTHISKVILNQSIMLLIKRLRHSFFFRINIVVQIKQKSFAQMVNINLFTVRYFNLYTVCFGKIHLSKLFTYSLYFVKLYEYFNIRNYFLKINVFYFS